MVVALMGMAVAVQMAEYSRIHSCGRCNCLSSSSTTRMVARKATEQRAIAIPLGGDASNEALRLA